MMAAWCGALVLGPVITQVVGRNAESQAASRATEGEPAWKQDPQMTSRHVEDVEGRRWLSGWKMWALVWNLSLTGCITLGKLLNLSGPPWLHL